MQLGAAHAVYPLKDCRISVSTKMFPLGATASPTRPTAPERRRAAWPREKKELERSRRRRSSATPKADCLLGRFIGALTTRRGGRSKTLFEVYLPNFSLRLFFKAAFAKHCKFPLKCLEMSVKYTCFRTMLVKIPILTSQLLTSMKFTMN